MKIVANLFGISLLFLGFGCGGAASTTKAEATAPAAAKSEKPCEGKKKSSAEKPCDKGAKAGAEGYVRDWAAQCYEFYSTEYDGRCG